MLLLILPSFAQKKLQVDRFGKKKAMYYQVGETLHFRLVGDDFFYALPIRDMDAEKQVLIFQTGEIKIKDIVEIKKFRNRGAVNGFSYAFISFGTVWSAFTFIGAVAGGPPVTVATAIIGGGFIVLGGLIKWLFTKRKYKIGGKRNMRVIDLNIDRPLGNTTMICPSCA